MLRLKQIKFKNIRCFTDEQSIDFSNRDKLVQVDGRNDNTGGSSGAGKTTVFLALDYLLGINDIPATTLQSRLTKDPIEVIGDFYWSDIPTTITRSKKTGLTIKVGEDIISGNVKLAEEKLDEIIGIPRKIFKKMVHKKQKEGGFFLSMTAKDTYEFLVNILGLDIYIKNADNITTNIKDIADKIDKNNVDFSILSDGVESLSEIVRNKKKPTSSIKPSDIEGLEKAMLDYEADTLALKEQRNAELNMIPKPEKIEEPFDNTRFISLQSDIKNIDDKMLQMTSANNSLQSSLTKVHGLKEKVGFIAPQINKYQEEKKKILHDSTCPTCKQSWTGELAEAKIGELDMKIKSSTEDVLSYKNEILKEKEYKLQLLTLEGIVKDTQAQRDYIQKLLAKEELDKISHIDKQNDKHKVALASYNNSVNEVKSKYEKQINSTKEKWNDCRNQYSSTSSSYAQYKKSLSDYEVEISDLAKMINEKNSKLTEIMSEQEHLKKKVLVAEESRRLIKSYVLQTFQETLDLIGDTATDILSAIPNMSNSTIYFEGCKENKDGSLKDEVNAVINIEGTNSIPIKSLSGGERTAIDLAVDLAVIDIIEAKAGKGADFFVIDEPFDGLDSVCKENCLEILKQVDTNKKIIMVDHSSELKEMVSDVITVVKNGENSVIQ